MISLKSFLFILFIFFINFNFANSNEKVRFVDLDLLLKNTKFGKSILKKINTLNDENIIELKEKEKKLKKYEEQIAKKKNIISDDEFKKEIELLKKDIKEFRIIKNNMVKNFKKSKNENLNNFFVQINPIIQEYMDKNSIDIMLDRKNVFMGKSDSDITLLIINEINNNLK